MPCHGTASLRGGELSYVRTFCSIYIYIYIYTYNIHDICIYIYIYIHNSYAIYVHVGSTMRPDVTCSSALHLRSTTRASDPPARRSGRAALDGLPPNSLQYFASSRHRATEPQLSTKCAMIRDVCQTMIRVPSNLRPRAQT